jgi:hypothetical protein
MTALRVDRAAVDEQRRSLLVTAIRVSDRVKFSVNWTTLAIGAGAPQGADLRSSPRPPAR